MMMPMLLLDEDGAWFKVVFLMAKLAQVFKKI
jgi:hypothetical protein